MHAQTDEASSRAKGGARRSRNAAVVLFRPTTDFEEAQVQLREGDAILVYLDNIYIVATLDRVCEITRRTGMHCGPMHAARNQMELQRRKAIRAIQKL